MIADSHLGLCPCDCKRVVPHNHFWATDACRQRARGRGIRMPVGKREFERVNKKIKRLKNGH